MDSALEDYEGNNAWRQAFSNVLQMRTAGYTLHHSLSFEAAAVVKQAVALAKRRGHSQVTPLHVASVLLYSSTGMLRKACGRSNSYPLQCDALDLCFNVALNRLPASVSSPFLELHPRVPCLSNALVAVFKRAQAQQRRGSVENQQQHVLLTVKVEVEQLVISILDDPSVSRVMREAGFSSSHVKNNVEQALSSEKFDSKKLVPGKSSLSTTFRNDDVMNVMETMMCNKSRNTVIVCENIATAESLVKGVMEKLEKFMQVISFPLSKLKNVSRNELDVKIRELRTLVKSYINREVVLYVGNLDWISEFSSRETKDFFYCSEDCMVMEISRLINGEVENKKLTLMGIATTHTYQKCRSGKPSLEAVWSLQPVSNLALGLRLDSGIYDSVKEAKAEDDSEWLSMNIKRESEHQLVMHEFIPSAPSSSLPSWLQHYKDENRKQLYDVSQEFDCKESNPSSPYSSSVSSNGQSKSKLVPELRSNPSSSPNSASSSETNEFKEPKSEYANNVCKRLKKKVPWHKDIIPDMVSAILRCRSGMKTSKRDSENREESWFFFLGADSQGKETIAKELAEAIFGSYDHFVSFSPNTNNKRQSIYDIFSDAVRDNPSRIFYFEDIDVLDPICLKDFTTAIKEGSFRVGNDEIVPLKDAIVIFCSESFDCRFGEKGRDEKKCKCRMLDLNIGAAAEQEADEDCKSNSMSEWCSILDLVDKQLIFTL